MPEKLRIGVIGTGNMGKNHIRILSEESNAFELATIYDPHSEKVNKLSETYRVPVAVSAEALLDGVDAVVIAAPSFLHKDIGLMAADRGVHALIEKPLALSGKDAEALCTAFEKTKKKLMVGHVERFNPVLTEMIKILAGEKIIAVEAARYSPFDIRISDTDVIFDLMIHDIDIVCNALCQNEVNGVLGFGCVAKSQMIDFANGLIQFQNGVLAKLSASRVTENKVRNIQVHTHDSYILADLLNRTLSVFKQTNMVIGDNKSSVYRQESVQQKIFVPMVEPLRMELLSFRDCIVQNNEPATNGAQAVNALRVVERLEGACRKQ